MSYFAGVDWAATAHAVCVIDETGTVRWRGTVPHSAAGRAELVQHVTGFGPPALLPVALERPSGLVVDTLLEAGFLVVPIHPNVVKASRPRYSAAGGKSDPGDASLLADLDVDSPISLAFLARYPTPSSAERLGERRLVQFLRRHAYCGRRSAAELLARVRRAPCSHTGDAETEASGELVQALGAVLTPLVAQIQQLSAAISAALAQHPDGPLLQSLPRSGHVNAAQILAELGDDRARFATPEQLAAEGGVAPVTHASGKHRGVAFRWACNKRLRQALTTFADNSRHASVWAAAVYARARTRGCDHPHAIRILARAWVRILWRCWQDRRPYDVTHHRAAQPLVAAQPAGG